MSLVIAGIVASGVYLSLLGMMRIDKEHGLQFTPKVWVFLCTVSVIAGLIWCVRDPIAVRCAWIILHIYFIGCSLTDYMTCQVYDLFQYVGVGAAGYLLLVSDIDFTLGFSIIIFALLQYFLFMRLYGKADGMTFMVAAMAETSLGYNMEGYFVHMIISYLLLSLVQGIKGNIGRKGRLKTAVPFLPYIMVGFWVMIIYS